MGKLHERAKEQGLSYRERCGEVCDDGCRQAAMRERALMQQLWLGVRA
jgi:hypothetical protein